MSAPVPTGPAQASAPVGPDPHERGFSTKIGFVLAAVGSAVGLGNVWRFPYFAATYGGGTFLVTYLVVIAVFGLMMMIAEITIGRATGLGPLGAFRTLHRRFAFLGVIAALTPMVIFPFYSVIGGWVTRYAWTFLTGGAADAAQAGHFGAFTSQTWQPILWLGVFVAVNAALLLVGVRKGIERVNVIAMPAFIVMVLALVVYGLTLDGALAGLDYFLRPDFSQLSLNTVVAATRQTFFSLSLSAGVMLTYGSYLRKDASIERSAMQAAALDTTVSLLAGLLVIPAVVAFMGYEGLGQGAGLLFITLPQVFASMPGGAFVGAVFFALMFVAAVTSGISLMEVPVATVMEKTRLKRRGAVLVVAAGTVLLALPTTLGFGVWSEFTIGGMNVLGQMSFLTDVIMMPLVGLGTAILVGWVLGPKVIAAVVRQNGHRFRTERLFSVTMRWIAPVVLVLVLTTSLLMALGVIPPL